MFSRLRSLPSGLVTCAVASGSLFTLSTAVCDPTSLKDLDAATARAKLMEHVKTRGVPASRSQNLPEKYATLKLKGPQFIRQHATDIAAGAPNTNVFAAAQLEALKAATDANEAASTANVETDSADPIPPALSPSEFRPFQLESVTEVSHNTKLFRFKLPKSYQKLGMTVTSCLVTQAEIDGACVLLLCSQSRATATWRHLTRPVFVLSPA